MTEAWWLACDDPAPMLYFLTDSGKASNRKLRLLVGACCRQFWDWLGDDRLRQAIRAAERFADGLVSEADLDKSRTVIEKLGRKVTGCRGRTAVLLALTTSAGRAGTVYGSLRGEMFRLPSCIRKLQERAGRSEATPIKPLRDIFNPFRPVKVDPVWRTPDVLALASTAYWEGAFPSGELDAQRLPILADALEEAGCAEGSILAHLRSPGPHVRGCWALDLILGKS
jgi:hypothetical protein